MHEFQIVGEVEKRYSLFGQTGRVLVTGFDSRGRMALLDGTIGLARSTGVNINTALVDARHPMRSRLEAFWDSSNQSPRPSGSSRASARLPATSRPTNLRTSIAPYRSARRSKDCCGNARTTPSVSWSSTTGFRPEREGIFEPPAMSASWSATASYRIAARSKFSETYYSAALLAWAHISVDYQFVKNPGYNADRGPVSIFAVRVHAQF